MKFSSPEFRDQVNKKIEDTQQAERERAEANTKTAAESRALEEAQIKAQELLAASAQDVAKFLESSQEPEYTLVGENGVSIKAWVINETKTHGHHTPESGDAKSWEPTTYFTDSTQAVVLETGELAARSERKVLKTTQSWFQNNGPIADPTGSFVVEPITAMSREEAAMWQQQLVDFVAQNEGRQ